jgi:ketosteroid isomerase-like protein
MRRPKPGPDAMAAAIEAAQRLAAEAEAEQSAEDFAQSADDDFSSEVAVILCPACGYQNRVTNKFCGMCGAAVEGHAGAGFSAGDEPRRPRPIALHPNPFLDPEPEPEARAEMKPSAPTRRAAPEAHHDVHHEAHEERHAATPQAETHHYHHHYHHHLFPGGAQEGTVPRSVVDPAREGERFRPTAALRGDMSRAEAAVRRIAHEWVLACNTKHLDDLLELYSADALVLRSNFPPIRGAAAVREFFFGALDAGLGEVELEPLRVEVMGDLAYEAGRCKALVPSATGKRREERGKYLWVLARQAGGEWKLSADSWSSDLTLSTMESDVPASAGVRSSQPRKS